MVAVNALPQNSVTIESTRESGKLEVEQQVRTFQRFILLSNLSDCVIELNK